MAEDGSLQVPQRTAGVDAQVGSQRPAHPVIDRQRISLPAGPVQRQHQLAVQLLIQRIGGDHLLQLVDELVVLPGSQAGLGQGPPDLRLQPLQPPGVANQARQVGHPGQRRTAPQVQRSAQVRHRPGGLGRRSALVQQPLSGLHVGTIRAQVQYIPRPAGHDRVLAQHAAQR